MSRALVGLSVALALGCGPRVPARNAAPDPAIASRLASNPDDVEARLGLAEARRAAGDREGALVEVYKAIASDPHSEAAQIARAHIYFDRGLISKEIEAWNAALAIAPDDAAARENLGHALLAAGRDADAAAEYRRVLAEDPGAKVALFNLAQLETDAKNDEVARTLWLRYLELDPTGPWAEKAKAHLGDGK